MHEHGACKPYVTCVNIWMIPYGLMALAYIPTVHACTCTRKHACQLMAIHYNYTTLTTHTCRLTSNLGSGQFGMVDRGVWYTHCGCTDVAVKTMKEGSCEDDQVKFLQEAAIMGQFSHPNVVKLYGVVTVGEPVSCSILPNPALVMCALCLHKHHYVL